MSQAGSTGAGSRRRLAWIIAAAVVVVVLVGAIVWWSAAGNGEAPSGSSSPSPSGSPAATSSAQPSTPAASDTPVPDPDETDEGEAPDERAALDPVPFDQPAVPAEGLTARVISIESFNGEAAVPGEVAGPALRVTVRVENAGDSSANISGAIANLYFGSERSPANILVSPREDLPLEVEPGGSVTGVYAFSVPADQRSEILLELDLSLDLPVVLFQGAV